MGHGHGKNLICIGECDHKALPHGHLPGKLLGKRQTHERISQIDDQLRCRHLQQGSSCDDDLKTGKLSRAGHIGQAHQRRLKAGQPAAHGHNAETEAHGKIPKGDRHAVPASASYFLFYHLFFILYRRPSASRGPAADRRRPCILPVRSASGSWNIWAVPSGRESLSSHGRPLSPG